MARSNTLKYVVGRVNDWAGWVLRLQSSGLGYPSHAPIANTAGSKPPPGPRVPNMVMNAEAAEVDRALRELEAELSKLIRHKHLSKRATDLELAREYCSKVGISMATYYRREKDAYMWLAGWLQRKAA